jgi:TonB family protein
MHVVAPTYPELARLARLTGDVTITFEVRNDGSISVVEVQGGHKLLETEALNNLKEWKFSPAMVGTHRTVTYRFELVGAETEVRPPAVAVSFDLPDQVTISAPPMKPIRDEVTIQPKR